MIVTSCRVSCKSVCWGLIWAGLFGLAGCESSINLDNTPEAMRPVVLSALDAAASPPGSAQLLIPTEPISLTYRRLDDNKADPFTVRWTVESNDPIAPIRKHAESQRQISHYAIGTNRRVTLHAVEDLKHNVIIRFADPLVVLDPTLRVGQSITTMSEGVVHDRSDPSKTRDRGPCQATLTYLGSQELDLPSGAADLLRLPTRLPGRLQLHPSDQRHLVLAWARFGRSGAGLRGDREGDRGALENIARHHHRISLCALSVDLRHPKA